MNMRLVFFTLAGGLALFIFGMNMMSDGLKVAFGDRLKVILEKITKSKVRGVVLGTFLTMVIQSSSATTVTLIGLLNAGIITLSQAVPVIMGANIGTTITAQLIAFHLGKYALAIIAIGFLIRYFGKKDSSKHVGNLLMGFGILFLGVNYMSSEVKMLAKSPKIVKMLVEFGKMPALGVLAGAIFTASIQSSSASSGLIIAMGIGGLIDLKSAIALIFGANIGTCDTALLASTVKSTLNAKRAAIIHLMFNLLGVIVFTLLIDPFTNFIRMTSQNLPRQIANAHMFFNIINTLWLLPLSGVLIAVAKKILPGEEVRFDKKTEFLDDHTLSTPPIALRMAELESMRMVQITHSMIEDVKKAVFDKDRMAVSLVKQKDLAVDDLDVKIEEFLGQINKTSLSYHQKSQLSVLTHVITDIERIGDHVKNIGELCDMRIQKKMEFSDEAMDELKVLFEKTEEAVKYCVNVIDEGEKFLISRIMHLEKEVDEMTIRYETNHMERLNKGMCTAESGPVYLDIVKNLERITDHAHNIAYVRRFGF